MAKKISGDPERFKTSGTPPNYRLSAGRTQLPLFREDDAGNMRRTYFDSSVLLSAVKDMPLDKVDFVNLFTDAGIAAKDIICTCDRKDITTLQQLIDSAQTVKDVGELSLSVTKDQFAQMQHYYDPPGEHRSLRK